MHGVRCMNTNATNMLHLVHAMGSPMASVITTARWLGESGAHLLLTGEAGTGKETLARMAHAAGAGGADAPFVVVQCSGRAEGALTRELFGPGDGAGTGSAGKLAEARGGTLYLEDVGELALSVQDEVLRAIDLAAGDPAGVAVRLVGASVQELLPRVATGRFRRELYEALGSRLRLPPLRERRDDVLAMMDRCSCRFPGYRALPPGARDVLRMYSWPGNVREVMAVAMRIAAACSRPVASATDVELLMFTAAAGVALSATPGGAGPYHGRPASGDPLGATRRVLDDAARTFADGERIDLPALLKRVESGLVDWALAEAGGEKAAAAALLGLRRTTLVEKLRRRAEAAARLDLLERELLTARVAANGRV